ncbi:hypothetical protein P5G65_20880 [Paenibacillus chondroitinus]|uniref:HPP family protein n=1 Tax=Paenibacillus chondroitinus TaxID=59842 RepID=A0ABU6DF37_9BACL|nr:MULTISPECIES: hypothetical protein [Paenibacillus]MCY9659299.1 hypothetical protein [Paenibacillus anseongense]MEB4796365.1 hypothetical protein [Paenibacillus chondroitinus]
MIWNTLRSKGFLSAYLLVILMLVAAVVLKQRDILFPEIAGMAMGVMVFPVAHWIKKPVHLWLAPTIGAFIGTALNGLTLNTQPKILLGLVIVVILMHIFRVNFGPTIPATLLPIFLGLHDYVFATTTAVFTFVIMLAAFRMRKSQKLPDGPEKFRKKTDTVIITIILALWIGLAFVTNLAVIVVPPVFALIFEVFHTDGFHWKVIPPRLAVLTATAILSVGVLHLLAGSIIWVGVINVVITLILCKWFKAPVPVAFGVSLMPLIFPAWGTWGFPVGVFATTGVLMCISAAYRQLRKRQTVQE